MPPNTIETVVMMTIKTKMRMRLITPITADTTPPPMSSCHSPWLGATFMHYLISASLPAYGIKALITPSYLMKENEAVRGCPLSKISSWKSGEARIHTQTLLTPEPVGFANPQSTLTSTALPKSLLLLLS